MIERAAVALGVSAARVIGSAVAVAAVCGLLWLGAGWVTRTADENRRLHDEVAQLNADKRVVEAVDAAMAKARGDTQARAAQTAEHVVTIEHRTEEVGRADPTAAEWLDQPVPRRLRDDARADPTR